MTYSLYTLCVNNQLLGRRHIKKNLEMKKKMRSNQKSRKDENIRDGGFTFIVPMTMAIVIGFALLVIGAYVVGTIGSTLEDRFTGTKTDNEESTVALIGNITDGFSSVVDIEIVVIIITALSMAILSIMAVGSRRSAF